MWCNAAFLGAKLRFFLFIRGSVCAFFAQNKKIALNVFAAGA